MQTVALSWQQAGGLAAGLGVVGCAMALSHEPHMRKVGAFARETAVIAALYGMWQLAGQLADAGSAGGYRRGHWVYRFEHDWLPLPSEASVQHVIIGHSWVVEPANLYYATMHFSMMFVFLFWLFWRHREHYKPVRQVLAWTTLACLLVQLIPVAPPRLTTGDGIVDLAKVYNQSVYNGFPADQLSAMPSVHVAWAVLVGWYTVRISPSRWRWIGAAHTVITVFVVVATGNHWWLDGIVAVVLLVACAWLVVGIQALFRAAVRRWRAWRSAGADAPPPEDLLDAAPAASR
ncbi:phosphatase PAP2 family protein [uncultured Jatrophihabitans sp.]|uniref:phosphatase PAP2 family protein n=1 Tax=uncultured Jatrophihabitans sp. TaxID=1610747 RepID=UPI0035CC047D